MKKILAFLLAALLLPSFTACKNNSEGTETSGGTENSVSAPSETTGPRTEPPRTTDQTGPGSAPGTSDPPSSATDPTLPSTPAPPSKNIAYLPVEGRENLWDLCFDDSSIAESSMVSYGAILGDRLLFAACTYIVDEDLADEDGEPYWESQWAVYLVDLRAEALLGSCEIDGDLYEAGFLDDGSVYLLSFSGDGESYGSILCRYTDFPDGAQSIAIGWEQWCGISGDGTVWLLEPEEDLLRATTPFDDRLESVYSCPDWNSVSYRGAYGGTAYFMGYGDSGASSFIGIRLSDGARTEYPHLRNTTWGQGALFSLYSDSEWRIAFPEDPYLVNAFPKRHDFNSISAVAGTRFVEYDYDREGEISGSYGVYDAKNGAELGRIFEAEDLLGLSALCMDEAGNLILACYSEDGALRILLWKYDAGEPTPSDRFRVIDVRGTDDERRRLADRIYERYGIRVFYDELSLVDLVSDYTCEYVDDSYTIANALERLSDALARFPDGIFDEMLTDYYGALEIYLCGDFTPTGEEGISSAGAITNTRYGAFIMAFNVHYMDLMEKNLAHELMHVMEYRLSDYYSEQGIAYRVQWDTLNPRGFDYYNSYHDENGWEIYDVTDTTWDVSGTAWFVDPYSKSFATEDRARVFEFLFVGDAATFKSPHLRAKADYLCELLRAAFPSVQKTDRAAWEIFAG